MASLSLDHQHQLLAPLINMQKVGLYWLDFMESHGGRGGCLFVGQCQDVIPPLRKTGLVKCLQFLSWYWLHCAVHTNIHHMNPSQL